jgi:hypothetical protein
VTVKYAYEGQVCRGYLNSNLLQSFTDSSHANRFPAIEVPGRDAVMTVHKAGLESARKQNQVISYKKHVDGDGKFRMHAAIIRQPDPEFVKPPN